MLLALVGITGIGKSYFKNKIAQELNFETVGTIRTRPMRIGEQNDKENVFMTKNELEKLKSENKIAYSFDVFGATYAYTKADVFSNKNMVFEMHYTTIYDWKKICPNIKTIYLMPKNIETAKNKTKERHLSKDKEIERLIEIDEHYKAICSNKSLRNMFDYIIYNNYDKKSEDKIINLVKQIIS